MAINVYVRGETVEITGAITDKDNAAANPSVSTVARIKHEDTAGASREVEDQAMTNEGLGLYYYPYDIPDEAASEGVWSYEVITTDGAGSYVSVGTGAFKVKKRLA